MTSMINFMNHMESIINFMQFLNVMSSMNQIDHMTAHDLHHELYEPCRAHH